MSEREQLTQAIASLEKLRSQLGDKVVDTTVSTLEEKLTRLKVDTGELLTSRSAQRKQVTILFANVLGFQEISEKIPDTAMLNVINLLWSRLDNGITQYYGVIDKHMGDAVMGLFGVPIVREDDPERAVRAAIAMRGALSNFVADLLQNQPETTAEELSTDDQQGFKKLRIRIGINTGPVLLGGIGVGDEYTVIGDAVNVASRLEKAAPDGGVLISHDTYLLVKDKFNVEPLGPVSIRGRSRPIEVYLVLGLKPRLFYEFGRGLEGVETRMIGRDREIGQLQDALKNTIDAQVGRHIRILGEAGVGKSRLIHEFGNWVRAQAENITIFKARTYLQSSQMPYALIRDLLATHFGIQDNEPATVVEQKLITGMSQTMDIPKEELRVKAQAIGQLIGLQVSVEMTNPTTNSGDTIQFREQAYDFVVEFLESVLRQQPALLIFLEDTHWADEGSIEMLAHLSDLCLRAPLIIVSLTRPTGLQLLSGTSPFNNPNLIINLKTLSPKKSYELVKEILQKLPEIPDDLSNLIVNQAEGNPFFVEELVKILIEDGVIITGAGNWQLRQNQLTEVRVPPHIYGVLQARLDRLSEPERIILQRAAVVGRVFWDMAVLSMHENDKLPLTQAQTLSALQALEKRELIFPRQISGFAGAQAFVFKHALLAQVTYESILLRQRPLYHRQVAEWYSLQSGDRIIEYAGLIAEHYELAGENKKAAELFELAANRALATYNSTLAMSNFRKALSLLAEKSHYALWQIRLQGELGSLLQRQARLVEAAQTYILMRFTAEDDGDLYAQARAWNGLGSVQYQQADYTNMLHSATEAERVAWLINAEMELVRALMHQGIAHIFLTNEDKALAAAKRAFEISENLSEPELFAQAVQSYGEILFYLGRYEEVEQIVTVLENHLALQEMLGNDSGRAVAMQVLAKIFARQGEFDQAGRHLLVALNLFRRIDDRLAICEILHAMGETARLQRNPRAAIPLYRKALALATSIGDHYSTLMISTDLGTALLEVGSYELAEQALLQVSQLTENISRMAGWRHKPILFAHLAAAELELGNLVGALSYAQEGLETAQKNAAGHDAEGLAWRQLGQVISHLPEEQRPYQIDDAFVDTVDCYARSLEIYVNCYKGGPPSYQGQIYTLVAWSKYEKERGNDGMATELNSQASELAGLLGITLE